MQFITIIETALGCTISFIGGRFPVVLAELAATCSGNSANFNRLGIDAKERFASINAFCYPLSNFIAEMARLFTPVIILPARNKIRDGGLVLMEDMEKKILAVNAKIFGSHA